MSLKDSEVVNFGPAIGSANNGHGQLTVTPLMQFQVEAHHDLTLPEISASRTKPI